MLRFLQRLIFNPTVEDCTPKTMCNASPDRSRKIGYRSDMERDQVLSNLVPFFAYALSIKTASSHLPVTGSIPRPDLFWAGIFVDRKPWLLI